MLLKTRLFLNIIIIIIIIITSSSPSSSSSSSSEFKYNDNFKNKSFPSTYITTYAGFAYLMDLITFRCDIDVHFASGFIITHVFCALAYIQTLLAKTWERTSIRTVVPKETLRTFLIERKRKPTFYSKAGTYKLLKRIQNCVLTYTACCSLNVWNLSRFKIICLRIIRH